MPGGGTKLVTTTNNPPPARLLDVTRLMRRAGRVLTGVDRVELAYLRALLAAPVPVFGLIRSRYGYLLMDHDSLETLAAHVHEARPDRLWANMRKTCLGRVPPPLLGVMLRRRLPRGTAYLNVGHSNLTERVLATVTSSLDARVTVLVHDTIPLDFPRYQRDGVPEAFAATLARIGRYADLIVCNSAETQGQLRRHLDPTPTMIVAHLGTELAVPAPSEIPPGVVLDGPYFVCVGTIEPRKNHALLLDLWDEMGPDAPGLVIAGHRGWKNDAILARLDALSPDAPVRVSHGLTDGAVAALVAGSRGLLLPSFAEGFGLPAMEAAALGVPVIANDLPAIREVLGNIPIYVNVADRYLWKKKIKALIKEAPPQAPDAQFVPPDWDAHFKTVLRLT